MLSTLALRLSRRPRRTLLAVLVFVIVAGVIGGPVAGSLRSSGGFQPSGAPSQVAIRELEHATGAEPAPGVLLLVRTPQGASRAGGRAALARARARLSRIPGIAATTPAAVAPGGREGFVAGTIRASASDADVAKAALAAFSGQRAVLVGGSAVASEQVGSTITKDLGLAEAFAAPLLILLSILLFRGRAALMPVVVGATTVLGTFLVMRGINEFYGLSIYALNLVIGLGLGLAVDYTLFIVTRFREELAAGRETPAAIVETMRHAGRTVLFSAATVAAALATLVLFPLEFLKSMGLAGAACALVAAAVAVCVTPALLGLWGTKLARGGTAQRARPQAGRWYRLAHAVMRHPGPVAVITAVVMLAAATPALSVRWTPSNDPSVIPKGESARVVSDSLTRAFGASTDAPVTVAITAPPTDGTAVRAFAGRVGGIADVQGRPSLRYRGSSTWELVAQVHGDSSAARAQRVVRSVRALTRPFPARVTGDAAEFLDQQQAIAAHLPLTVGLLAALTFIILWLMTGSLVLPLKAIVMNVLTVGAALSAIVVVYQHGRLTGLLHYTPDGGVEPTDFVVSATVVFALSTDYGVFLLARIREARESLRVTRGSAGLSAADEREAVAAGLGATGRVVTGAAILLAVAIGAFSTSQISFIQQIGVAVAIGVLLDAFVVRSLLVPSLMALLGRFNWWAPTLGRRRGRARGLPA